MTATMTRPPLLWPTRSPMELTPEPTRLSVSAAYDDLVADLRDLAGSILSGTVPAFDDPPAAQDLALPDLVAAPQGVETAAAVLASGALAVAVVAATAVLLFHVAFELFPPSRPSVEFAVPAIADLQQGPL